MEIFFLNFSKTIAAVDIGAFLMFRRSPGIFTLFKVDDKPGTIDSKSIAKVGLLLVVAIILIAVALLSAKMSESCHGTNQGQVPAGKSATLLWFIDIY